MKNILFLLLTFISVASYAQQTDAALKTQFDIIRNEPNAGGNTKARIADAFQALADSKVNRSEVIIASGTNDYAITINSTIVDLSHNPGFRVKFVNGNTGAVTLTATPSGGSSLGSVPVKKNVSMALSSGDIPPGAIFDVIYDGTNYQINISGGGGGSGTVTTVSVTAANGVSGSVATATTTPAITLSLGAITPTSVNSVVFSGSSSPTLAVTGTTTISGTHAGTSSGTNTGDQTNITGNAATVTTNANLTGPVTSVGNATTITSSSVSPSMLTVAGLGLTPTAVKTANYTAVVKDLIPVDASSGSVTITLPTTPVDGASIAVIMINTASTNTTIINCGGSDVINKTSGLTTYSLTQVSQSVIFQYKNSTGIWYVVSSATGATPWGGISGILSAQTDLQTALDNKQTILPDKVVSYGKTIVFFGDSYTVGVNASVTAKRWTSVLCQYTGAIEDNHGVSGTTLEKRATIDWAASPNMVDNATNIPTKVTGKNLLVFAYGLNDIGFTSGSYTSTNFVTDYTTVLNTAISKGWDPSQILILSPYFIGSAGYTTYAGLSGTPAPTQARHLQFVAAARQVAGTFGTLYLDIYNQQRLNDQTLFGADGLHPNDAGYAYIANQVFAFLYGGNLSYGNLVVDNFSVLNPTGTALFAGAGGTLVSLNDHQLIASGGAYYSGGFKALPTASTAAIINIGNAGAAAGYSFYINTGLTAGAGYTPTERGRWDSNGLWLGGTIANATSKLCIGAGSTTANTAPLGFSSGPTETTIRAGTYQYNDNHYLSNGALNQLAAGGKIAGFTTAVSNTSTTETDLFTYTTKASTLAKTDEEVEFTAFGTFNDLTATVQLRFYFAGTSCGDTGALTVSSLTGAYRFSFTVRRTGSTTAVATVDLTSSEASVTGFPLTTNLTGLTFTGTNIIKVTGTAGGGTGGTGDITATTGKIIYTPAANN